MFGNRGHFGGAIHEPWERVLEVWSRPKCSGSGLGKHRGVAVFDAFDQVTRVVHYSPDGVEECSPEEFLQGYEGTVVARVTDPGNVSSALARIEEVLLDPSRWDGAFSILRRNCQHFASEMATGEADSPDIRHYGEIAVAAAGLVLLSRM